MKRDNTIIYNSSEIVHLKNLVSNGYYTKARKCLDQYKEIYGQTHFLYKLYDATLCGYEGKYEEAISKFLLLFDSAYEHSKEEIAYYLMLLFLEIGDYENSYKYCSFINIASYRKEIPNKFKKGSLRTKNFLVTKLGLPISENVDNYSYNQSYYYSDLVAKNHIYDKHNIEADEEVGFNMSYENLSKIYDYINLAILHAERTFDYTYGNVYYFKIPEIGFSFIDNKHLDIIKVVTNRDEPEILSMFLMKRKVKNNDWYINEVVLENSYSNSKVRKRESMIDKFNKRYNLK